MNFHAPERPRDNADMPKYVWNGTAIDNLPDLAVYPQLGGSWYISTYLKVGSTPRLFTCEVPNKHLLMLLLSDYEADPEKALYDYFNYHGPNDERKAQTETDEILKGL